MMKRQSVTRQCGLWVWFGVALCLVAGAGCAPAWKSYAGCHVDCHYCAPPPLPVVAYPDCACHGAAVSRYLRPAAPPSTLPRPPEADAQAEMAEALPGPVVPEGEPDR